MPVALKTKHNLPVFDGSRSRRHRAVPAWKLRLLAGLYRCRHPGRFRKVETCVQFVGFPRSGHSLIGSILDAHPEATISHELDAMGLIDDGFSEAEVYALMAHNSEEFSQHGRFWNGFSYHVPHPPAGSPKRVRVIGDKKGDWVARRIGADPELLKNLERRFRARQKWILVVRHPLDNIATMSLRKGRVYDRLRIECDDSQQFRRALKERQDEGKISARALDSMIEDYRSLCEAIQGMQSALPREAWHEVVYEQFVQNPESGIGDLLQFLELPQDDAFIRAASSIVRPSPRNSRDNVVWNPEQIERVQSLIRTFPFLRHYVSDQQPHPQNPANLVRGR